MQLGERIRQLRDQMQLSLEQLAYLTGMQLVDLQAVERGERQLAHGEIMALSQALHIEFDELFKQSQAPVPATPVPAAPAPEPEVGEGVPNPEESVLIPADRLTALLDEMKQN